MSEFDQLEKEYGLITERQAGNRDEVTRLHFCK